MSITFPFIVNSAPDPDMLAGNLRYHLVEMPTGRWRQFTTTKVCCDLGAELQCPGADRFVAHVDATMREHLFNVTQAECEAEIEPNGVLNHGGWEAVPFVGNSRHWGPREANIHGPHQRLVSIGLTAPLDDIGSQAFFIILAPRPLALRRAMLSEHPADPTLGQLQLRSNVVDAGAATRGA